MCRESLVQLWNVSPLVPSIFKDVAKPPKTLFLFLNQVNEVMTLNNPTTS